MGNQPEIGSRFWRSSWIFWVGLSLLKVWLISHLPIRASYAGYDNLRYVVLASNLLDPQVPYDAFTLVRQPGYPGFICLSYLLGIPLRLSQEFMYLAAGLFFAWSSHKYYFTQRITLIFATLYILAPFSFHWNRQTLADVLYLPLTVWIVGCLIHVLNSKCDRSLIGWSLALGVGFAWFWNTRLEGIWIVPSIGLSYGVLGWKYRVWSFENLLNIHALKVWAMSLFSLIAPMVLMTSGISWINESKYGIWATNDLKSSGVEATYSSLEKVQSYTWQPRVEISRSIREQVYAVSPSFRQLQSEIESENHWRKSSCDQGICNDYAAGLFYWVLRESVAKAGYYQSAPATEAFYYQISQEVDAACQGQRLTCHGEKVLAFLPDFHLQYLPLWMKSIGKLGNSLVYSSLILKLDSGEEDRELRQNYYTKMTRESADFIDQRSYRINQVKDRIIVSLSQGYRVGFTIVLGLAVLGLMLESMTVLKKGFSMRSSSFIVVAILLGCIFVRLGLIAYIDVTSWSVDTGDRYLRPVLPLFWWVMCMGMMHFMQQFDRGNKKRVLS